jgi:hypothetical protein
MNPLTLGHGTIIREQLRMRRTTRTMHDDSIGRRRREEQEDLFDKVIY